MWLRAFEAARAGHHVSKLVGDGWQMPGCFMLHLGRILSSFPYDMVADRPDYLEFVDSALRQDLSQLATLRPDGSVKALLPAQTLTPWTRTTLDGRPRLLLVGGDGSTPERFQPTQAFLRETFATHVVEIAGQGTRADVPLPSTLEAFAKDLALELQSAAAALQAGGASGPLVLYGHGIGGLLLAHAVRFLPIRPASLILHSPGGAQLTLRQSPAPGPALLSWPGAQAVTRTLLGHRVLGPALARKLLGHNRGATEADRQRFARGYRLARSFGTLLKGVKPETALEGLETLTVPTVLLWGARDPLRSRLHLPEWSELLARAPVRAHVEPDWGPYPYLDDPQDFARGLLQSLQDFTTESLAPRLDSSPTPFLKTVHFHPRSKAGRLIALHHAGLPCPSGVYIPANADDFALRQHLARLSDLNRWAVRSSATTEDPLETTGAERQLTLLEVPRSDLLEAIHRVRRGSPRAQVNKESTVPTSPSNLDTSACDVVLQPMIPRTAAGVAWVRPLGADIELMTGDPEGRGEERTGGLRAHVSRLGAPWQSIPERLPGHLTPRLLCETLEPLLQKARVLFAVPALEVEWSYHPEAGFTLLRARPLAEGQAPRRLLSAATLQELLPPVPSPLLVDTAQAASVSIPRYFRQLDPRLAGLHEPFTCTENGRFFLNVDLLAAVFQQWGLPLTLLQPVMGGNLPQTSFSLIAFLRAIPVFWRVLRDQSEVSKASREILETLRTELPPPGDMGALLHWCERAFAQGVMGNLRITGILALMAIGGGGSPSAKKVRRDALQPDALQPDALQPAHLQYNAALKRLGAGHAELKEAWGHRCAYESDPAWPRGDHPAVRIAPRPFLPEPLSALPSWKRRLPWFLPESMVAHREWFRDSSMRLWAAFRSRLVQTAQGAVDAGVLEEAESIFSLGIHDLNLSPEQWERALSLSGRAPAEKPPQLFWSDSLQPLEPLPTPVVVVRAGVVEGHALVAQTPQQALSLLRRSLGNPILVAPAVGPGWEPVFQKVVGVITEQGTRLSYAAVLLREDAHASIPVALHVPGVTTQVKNGDPVRLEVPPGRLISLPTQA